MKTTRLFTKPITHMNYKGNLCVTVSDEAILYGFTLKNPDGTEFISRAREAEDIEEACHLAAVVFIDYVEDMDSTDETTDLVFAEKGFTEVKPI